MSNESARPHQVQRKANQPERQPGVAAVQAWDSDQQDSPAKGACHREAVAAHCGSFRKRASAAGLLRVMLIGCPSWSTMA